MVSFNGGNSLALTVSAFIVAGFISGGLHRQAKKDAFDLLHNAQQALAAEKLARREAERDLYSMKDKVNAKQQSMLQLYHKMGQAVARREVQTTQWKEPVTRLPMVRTQTNHIHGMPRCNANLKPQSLYDKLPVYVFICGIECAGPHAIETVLEELQKYYDIAITTYNPGLHSFAKHPNVSRAYQFPSISLEKHRNTFSNFLKGPKVHGSKLIFDTRNSYPEGFGVGSLGHPDLAFLSALDGVLLELRVLVLHRDPVASVLSAVRRFKVQEFQYKNYQYQARVVQESLTMINNGLSTVPCGKSMILPYEALLDHPDFFTEQLATLFGVEPSYLAKCYGQLKPQPRKTVDGDVAKMTEELSQFFQFQQHLWPNIASYGGHPPLSISRKNARKHNIKSTSSVTEMSRKATISSEPKHIEPTKPRKNYLKITWHTNLGFNNMRFIMEEGLYLAKLLNRKLILAPSLRMRLCTDTEACEASDCTEIRGNYWCPITAFLSWSALSSAGAVVIQQEKTFTKGKTVHAVENAFDDMFNKSTLYLEKLPPQIKKRFNSKSGEMIGSKPFTFSYYKFQLGCELSYFRSRRVIWNSNNSVHREMRVKSFVDIYGDDPANILHLKGIPHFIGLTPTFWSSEESLNLSKKVWTSGIAYHASIVATAKVISQELVAKGTVKSYMCVHLRRGDFVSAGWLGEAADLLLVKRNIMKRQIKGEMIYMATDEQNATTLKMFRDIGVRTWADFHDSIVTHSKGKHAKMVAFEDYVGLVEQTICARARLFVGSKCSSFTGGILNLRRNVLGDHKYYTTTK